ncbi:MAG: TetR/AcrR family transcriptional regulator [Acidobacteriota bacterium]|nr:TetR/AcrR family transcriptional regulator [Acidobacteriota bacterium]
MIVGAEVGARRPAERRGAHARVRRAPVQERSRRTVSRILQAAEEIVGESGVDAASTRAIAARAKVTPPSLYRFFADRNEILDALLEAIVDELDGRAEEAERGFTGTSVEDFVRMEMALHVAYYEQHPSVVALWFGGRVSPAIVKLVRERNRTLARRAKRILCEAALVDAATPDVVFELLVEYGDRTLDLAFRGRRRADAEVVETGVAALTAFAERWRAPGGGRRAAAGATAENTERSE